MTRWRLPATPSPHMASKCDVAELRQALGSPHGMGVQAGAPMDDYNSRSFAVACLIPGKKARQLGIPIPVFDNLRMDLPHVL